MPEEELLAQAKEKLDGMLNSKADIKFVEKEIGEVKETIEKLEEKAAKADWAKGIEEKLAGLEAQKIGSEDTYLKGFDYNGQEIKAGPWKAVEGKENVFEKFIHLRDELPLNDAWREKAALSNVGAPVNMMNMPTAWTEMQRGNEYMAYVDSMPVAAAVAPTLQVSGMGFTEESSATDSAQGEKRGTDPGLAASTENVKAYVMQTFISEPALQDNPGVQSMLEQRTVRAYGRQVGDNIHSALVAQATGTGNNPKTGGIRFVKTGVPATLPVDGKDLVKQLIQLVRVTPKEYRQGGEFFVSAEVWGLLTTEFVTELYHNPQNGVVQLAGRNVHQMDSFPDAAANNRVAFFGNIRDCVYVADREVLSIRMYPETKPGSMTFFARGRHCVPKLDPKCITSYIVTNA